MQNSGGGDIDEVYLNDGRVFIAVIACYEENDRITTPSRSSASGTLTAILLAPVAPQVGAIVR
ncbi:hypothetical protein LFL96_34440 [Paraburkholderia sp. D15]|uniref:hypothetical protein n=1 Tax=Paraburkholderia sp. D15 TaxID=2880218 RepID=UPI00247A90C3|nr:hypothetical protein [Paraburkholderia sp. D15]WGS53264.1 hypothetical protein LFL96_34440 [Paraburkholderia sp. D15]